MRDMKIAAAGAALVLLAGCSSSASSAGGSASFPNPVTLIGKAAGCLTDPGVNQGSLAIAGDFMVADCTFGSQETMTVKTFKTASALKSDLAAYTPQDGEAAIAGSDWVAYVHAAPGPNGGGYSFDPDALMIATQLGGTVQ